MRPPTAFRPGGLPVVALALLLGASSACRETDPPGENPVARIELMSPSLVLRPGLTMLLSAEVLNRDGEVLDVAVTWSSLTPTRLQVAPNGLVLALAPGQAIARASVGTVTAEITLELRNPPATSLTFENDSAFLLLPGGPAPITPIVLDSVGGVIVGAALNWTSSAPRIATVSSNGLVTPLALGRTTIAATFEGHTAQAIVTVDAQVTETSPLIANVSPATVRPGVPVVISGERFALTPAANQVLVDGIPMTVSSATARQLTAVLPVNNGHCLPTAGVKLQVNTSTGIGVAPVTLNTASERTLAVGEALIVTSATESACNELVSSEGRYLLAVTNGARALGAGSVGIKLEGRSATAVASLASVGDAGLARTTTQRSPVWAPDAGRRARRLAAHGTLLDQTRRQLDARRSDIPLAHRPSEATLQVPPLNGIVPVRVPNLDSQNFCQNFLPIGGRAVFIGAHVVILEDTSTIINGAPTLAGQLDSSYAAIGAEIESVIWPIITKFGDPLVMDDRLDDNDRIFVVFTPRMNFLRNGEVLGAVVSCDFFTRAQFASSNVGEVLFAQVPVLLDPGFGLGTRARWRHEMRSAVAHELKHIVSFGERIVRGQPLEEFWLEEALARHSEELFARALRGTVQNGNGSYAAGVRCDALFGTITPGCEDQPRIMLQHFEGLWTFLDAPTTHSPLGGESATDLSFYGSAWALTRWAIDHRAASEAALLNAFTIGGLSGLANLEARAELSWDQILGRWALAMMTDDRPGFTPADPRLTFPSWNVTGIFAGLCNDLGPCNGAPLTHPSFGRTHPVAPAQFSAGNFELSVDAILPGGFQPIEISGGSGAMRQLLKLRSADGGPLSSSVRIAIVRVQ